MSHPDRKLRLFVALELPREARAALAAWGRVARHGAGEARVLDERLLHVTLCFLGATPAGDVDAVADCVTRCAAPASGLSLGAPLWLPPRRPRVLAVEVHDEGGAVAGIHADLVRELGAAIGLQPEHRRLRPHVTVCRMRSGAAPRERDLPPTPSLTFDAEAVTLYRSHLSPAGASYEALERAELTS